VIIETKGITVDTDTAAWVKSSYSGESGNCVEIAPVDGHIAMRDSKNPDAAVLVFTGDEFTAFVNGASAGEFAF
jgi:hypothetical protein